MGHAGGDGRAQPGSAGHRAPDRRAAGWHPPGDRGRGLAGSAGVGLRADDADPAVEPVPALAVVGRAAARCVVGCVSRPRDVAGGRLRGVVLCADARAVPGAGGGARCPDDPGAGRGLAGCCPELSGAPERRPMDGRVAGPRTRALGAATRRPGHQRSRQHAGRLRPPGHPLRRGAGRLRARGRAGAAPPRRSGARDRRLGCRGLPPGSVVRPRRVGGPRRRGPAGLGSGRRGVGAVATPATHATPPRGRRVARARRRLDGPHPRQGVVLPHALGLGDRGPAGARRRLDGAGGDLGVGRAAPPTDRQRRHRRARGRRRCRLGGADGRRPRRRPAGAAPLVGARCGAARDHGRPRSRGGRRDRPRRPLHGRLQRCAVLRVAVVRPGERAGARRASTPG